MLFRLTITIITCRDRRPRLSVRDRFPYSLASIREVKGRRKREFSLSIGCDFQCKESLSSRYQKKARSRHGVSLLSRPYSTEFGYAQDDIRDYDSCGIKATKIQQNKNAYARVSVGISVFLQFRLVFMARCGQMPPSSAAVSGISSPT